MGSAHFVGDHRDAIWAGHQLRVNLEIDGVQLASGLHAKNDSARTRTRVYREIAQQHPRIDATMLLKHRALDRVQRTGKVGLYKIAYWLHLQRVIRQVSNPGDRVFVVVGHLATSNRRDALRQAVGGICSQIGHDRDVIPCVWAAPTSWGIQVADYALWSVQRLAEGKAVASYSAPVRTLIATELYPWGRA